MALLSGYATLAEYRAAKGDKATGTDTTTDAQLVGVSRLLEKTLNLPPGAFNSVASQTLYLDGHGGDFLPFRDDEGRQWFVQSINADGIGIDSENDGTYDGYTLDLNDAWVAGWPANAAAGSEPYRGLKLLSYLSTADPSSWPRRERAVKLTCTTGWSAVPQLVKDLVIHRTEELKDALKAGSTGELASFDGGQPMRPNTTWMFKEAERLYGARLPVVA